MRANRPFRLAGGPAARVLAAAVACGLLVAAGVAAAAPIPHESTGQLGPLLVDNAALTFYTDEGRYAIDGVIQNPTVRRAVQIQPDAADVGYEGAWLAAYDFIDVQIGPGTMVTVEGTSPLLILSQTNIQMMGIIDLIGRPGEVAGPTAGGGGGAGGGAVGLFAIQDVLLGGSVMVDGGSGGYRTEGGSDLGGAGALGNAGGGGGGGGGCAEAGGTGGDGGEGAMYGLETQWVNLGVRMGGGGGGGGGAYDGGEGSGASAFGQAGNPGADGKCKQLRSGGDGGNGGAANNNVAGGSGSYSDGYDGGDAPQTGLQGGGAGGGGGGGGGAPLGGKGGRGGKGGWIGGGGGGGGGGGDVCDDEDTPGKGRSGGGGGGGGSRGSSGTGGEVFALGSENVGGGGGGGRIAVGSRDGLVSLPGNFGCLGGVGLDEDGALDNYAGGGTMSVYGIADLAGGWFNGIPVEEAGEDMGFYLVPEGLLEEDFALVGGGGGGGASGDGLRAPDGVLGDCTGDGCVNYLDLGIVATNYGTGPCGGTAAIPEPAALVLLAAAAPTLARRRRKR